MLGPYVRMPPLDTSGDMGSVVLFVLLLLFIIFSGRVLLDALEGNNSKSSTE